MNKWERLRAEILKGLYAVYMESHRDWFDMSLRTNDEFNLSDVIREADYLCEKGWVRCIRSVGGYQLTAEGRDHVERNLIGVTSKPTCRVLA